MRRDAHYLLFQIARFGALRIHELAALTQGRCRQRALYSNLSDLVKLGLIERFCHPIFSRSAYRATLSGMKAAFGKEAPELPHLRERDVKHTLRVAQTLIALGTYENVTGVATELELPRVVWKDLGISKIPDGLIQITSARGTYEIALEVEVSPKSDSRCQEFLNKYDETLKRGTPCAGVIVQCDASDVFHRYQTLIRERSKTLQDQMLFIQGPAVHSLNAAIYGRACKNPAKCAQLRRTHCGGSPSYFPIESTQMIKKPVPLPTHRGSQTENLSMKENLQLINQSGT